MELGQGDGKKVAGTEMRVQVEKFKTAREVIQAVKQKWPLEEMDNIPAELVKVLKDPKGQLGSSAIAQELEMEMALVLQQAPEAMQMLEDWEAAKKKMEQCFTFVVQAAQVGPMAALKAARRAVARSECARWGRYHGGQREREGLRVKAMINEQFEETDKWAQGD
jgi:hypothetical protein